MLHGTMSDGSSHTEDTAMESTTPPEMGETAPATDYNLSCNDCTFRTAVNGTVYDALDVAESHQREHSETGREHFVDLRVSDYEP